ncbi:ABC transporter substrate-binding protein [Aminipila butyrica]|uniref:ABC transporter substrate-binding protein n=1 Tax=Aminipila butyrica TaxID=433296 RepID=A0A858BUM4_9FIRM|nr:ABC transporter substrate-binding protein [Aminipila butyrica]QIB68775.1 ABC transporter substrate-binding protein [Aminipila butyrica]
MRSYKKWGCCLLAAVLGLTLLGGCGSEQQEVDQVTVCEVTHSIFYAPQYVAMNLGFFEEEGIQIELSNGQGADKVMAAVLSDNVDIGFSGPEASIYVYNEGKDDHTQVFAQLTQRDGSFLVGREKDEDFSWDKVRGKVVLPGRKGGVPYMALEYVMRQNGVDPAKDTILDNSIQFALMAGAFTSGTGDYVTLFEPTASMLEAEGKGYIVASIGQESGEIPYTAYFAKQSFIRENEDLIQRFTNAVYKGQLWVQEHSAEEIAEAVAPSFPDTDMSILTTVVERYKSIDAWSADPILREEPFDLLQEVMTQAGELTKKADYNEVVNNMYAEEAVKNQ